MSDALDKLHRVAVRAGIDPYTGNALSGREAPRVTDTPADDLKNLALIFEKTAGSAFEPRDRHHPFVKRVVEAGYMKWTDGRCGFERFKDSHLAFTPEGRDAIKPFLNTGR